MIKCFLSHSNNDKKSYVSKVASILGPGIAEYDAYTFEAGMKTLDEIITSMKKSQLFVIFLSNSALDSEWVKTELTNAKKFFDQGIITKVFPIILDQRLTYKDGRIPEWMRKEYNLKLISRPTVAARRIKQRLRELSWDIHPKLKEREKIFVGRNDLINLFEERMDDYEKERPVCVFATGLKRIGRKSLLKSALNKSNIFAHSYRPPIIGLYRHESIEDFIIKITELGFSKSGRPSNLLSKTVDQKIQLAIDLSNDMQLAKETLFIEDDGCLVNYERKIEEWFIRVIENVANSGIPLFAVAPYFRPKPNEIRKFERLFMLELPELSVMERKGLLRRYLESEGIILAKEDFEFYANLLYGYPEQVIYTADLIVDEGPRRARDYSYQIREYNSEKASITLLDYQDNPVAIDLLSVLARFEFISLEFLFDIVEENLCWPLLNAFISSSICDFIGVEREFVRLNDTIRDHILRVRFVIPDEYQKNLEKHVKTFLKMKNKLEVDVSDYIYSITNAIISGKKVNEKYLIPSHFLMTIRDLYNHQRQYDRVIQLADLILQKKDTLDNSIETFIRYFLCRALARKRDRRFLSEVQLVPRPEYNFLLGFYYRLKRRHSDAVRELKKAVNNPITKVRARRELVQVYVYLQDYENAFSMAEENYRDNPSNHFNIQAYFNCLINLPKPQLHKDTLSKLVNELKKSAADQAHEMALICEAIYKAKCLESYEDAINLINDAIDIFPESPYVHIAKFDICAKFKDLLGMENEMRVLQELDKDKKNLIYNETLIRMESVCLAIAGRKREAIQLIDSKLRNIPKVSRENIRKKISAL